MLHLGVILQNLLISNQVVTDHNPAQETKKVIDLPEENQSLEPGRDDLTRTGDLAPPRREL